MTSICNFCLSFEKTRPKRHKNAGQFYHCKKMKNLSGCSDKNAVLNVWIEAADQLDFNGNFKFFSLVFLNLFLKIESIFNIYDF